MIMMEAWPAGVTERQSTRRNLVPMSTKVVPSSSFPGQRMSVEPTDIHSDSSVEIMPSVEVPGQSPIAGLVGAELPTT